MIELVDVALLVLLAVTGITIIRLKNLFAAVMLAGIYSLVSAALFVVMDAVDVAFTEAAVALGSRRSSCSGPWRWWATRSMSPSTVRSCRSSSCS